jgi:DNA-binding MarR family transcriptional regulator
MGYNNELKNRFIHVDYKEQSAIQSAKVPNTKSHNGTMKMTLEEMAIIKVLQTEPSATQKRIAELTGKSERTIKRRTVEMQEKGLIRRENGKRNGRWEVLVTI